MNKMKENAYITYTLIESYFHKCSFKNKFFEKSLFTYYCEMKSNRIEKMERLISKKVLPMMEAHKSIFSNMNAEIQTSVSNEGLNMIFYTGFEKILVYVSPSGIVKASYVEFTA